MTRPGEENAPRGPRNAVIRSAGMVLALTGMIAAALLGRNIAGATGQGANKPVAPYQMVFMDRGLGETATDASAKACYAELARSRPADLGTVLDKTGYGSEGVAAECVRQSQRMLLTIADLDQDNLTDVATLTREGKLVVFWNMGWGFRPVEVPSGTVGVVDGGQLLSGFIDGDDLVDLVNITENGSVSVLKGLGDRQFGEAQVINAFMRGGHATLADIDRDSFLDLLLVSATQAGESLVVLAGGRDGLAATAETLVEDIRPGVSALRVADLDEDGDLEVLLAGAAGLQVYDDREGSWTDIVADQREASRWVRDVAVADVDDDGVLDLIATGTRPGLATCGQGEGCADVVRAQQYPMLWIGTGTGFRVERRDDAVASAWGRAVTATDLNLDGVEDAVAAAGAPAPSRVAASWPGAFERPSVLLGGHRFTDGLGALFRALQFNGSMSMVASVDFDADTRPDLFFSGEENAAPYVYLNRSVGDSAMLTWRDARPGDRIDVLGPAGRASYVSGGTTGNLHLGPTPLAVGLGGKHADVVIDRFGVRRSVQVQAGQHALLPSPGSAR